MNTRNALRMVAGLALTIGALPQAHAVTGCTSAMLTGAYGWRFSGSLTKDLSGGVGGATTPATVMAKIAPASGTALQGAADSGPMAATGVARLFLDGAGGIFGNTAANVDGVWSEGPVTGSYTVNDDCTASFTLTDSGAGTQHFDAIVVNQGETADLLQTDKGVGIGGGLRRARGFCQPSDIIGSFGSRMTGTLQDSGAFSSVGRINVDDQGNITASESRFSGGVYSQVASTGTLTVNADCTLTLTLSANADGSLSNFRGMIVNNLKELVLVQSDDGAAVTGSLVAQ